MKIDRTNQKQKSTPQVTSSDSDKRVNQTSSSKFLNFMDKADDDNFDDRMKKLAQDIFEQGEKLGKRVDVRDLRLYKNMIAEFLNQMTGNAKRFNKHSKIDRRGRVKVYVTIDKINEELETLTADVLSVQRDNIKILKRIEDIRGMILDFEL